LPLDENLNHDDYPFQLPPSSAIVTLLAPLKHLTALKLSQLSILIAAASLLDNSRSNTPAAGEPIESAPLPPTPSEILGQIGAKLRQLREQSHLSIEDISVRTRIQPRLIQAIEEGHIEMLPEPVYVKGMVKRYGNSLGLDGMAISEQVPSWEPQAASFEPLTKIQVTGFNRQTTSFNRPVWIKPLHIYLGYTLAIIGIGAITSHLLNNAIKRQPRSTGVVVQPHRAVGIAVSPQPIQLPDVPVEIVVKSPTWAQIGIDGTTKFTGSLKPGTKFKWIAKKQVTISTSNAGGLLFSRDAQLPKPLGKIGQKQTITIKVRK
jgi:cytoskeletal protein RodZ